MNRILREYGLLLLLLLPLFFLNIRDTHDWGGDFAHYLAHARNIVTGQPYADFGFVFNPDYASMAPQATPVGFPLLISPVYALWGPSIMAFNYYITVFLVAFLVLIYVLVKERFSPLISYLVVVGLAYNHWILGFKEHVMSDIPFVMCTLAFYLLWERKIHQPKQIVWAIVIGILAGYAILLRSIGWVVPVAVLLYWGVNCIKQRQWVNTSRNLFMLGSLLLVVFIIPWMAGVSGQSEAYYAMLIGSSDLFLVMERNLAYYLGQLQSFFLPFRVELGFLPKATSFFAIACIMIGFVRTLLKKVELHHMLSTGFLLAVIVFPVSTQGFRLMLPILPFLMIYLISGITSIQVPRLIHWKYGWTMAIGFLFLIQNGPAVVRTIRGQGEPLPGPYTSESQEMFAFVQTHISVEDTILFIKPRPLSFYTGRKSMAIDKHIGSESFEEQVDRYGLRLYLQGKQQLINPPLDAFMDKHRMSLDTLFQNSQFVLTAWRQ